MRSFAAAAAMLLATTLVASEPDGSVWVRITGSDLAGRRLAVENGGIHSTAYRLGGGDSAKDGIWIPLERRPAEVPRIELMPSSGQAWSAEVVTVPDGLSEGWSVIPLPLSAWGADGLDEIERLRLSERRGRWRAGSAVRRDASEATCGDEAPSAPPDFSIPLVVAHFESLDEPLGNRYGAFQGRGASVTADVVRDDEGSRLRIETSFPGGEGFGGVWFHLGPPALLAAEDAGVDLSQAAAVVVRGRGVARGRIGVSDVRAAKKDESVKIGALRADDERWSVILPLDRRIDRRKLRSIVIDLTGSGDGVLEIDEIVLVADKASIPPPVRLVHETESRGHETATWIWNTRDLLDPDSPERARLAKAVRQWNLTEVYLQIPHDGEARSIAEWGAVDEPKRVGSLVAWIRSLGVAVHALDGAPYFALPEAREELLSIARGVAAFNRQVDPTSRFDALHMDIEPYLLPAWSGPRRTAVLESLGESIPQMREAASVPVWLDIPFWFDSVSEERSPERGRDRGCARSRFLRKLFEEADGVGIMAYRTKGDGPGGIARAAMSEAAMARALDRPFRVGVETIDLPAESGWMLLPGAAGDARAGEPLALIPRGSRHVLFSPGATRDDLAWLAERRDQYDVPGLEYEEGVAPGVITFFGRSGEEIRREAELAIRLLRAAGLRADGIAYHELRSLPLR